MSPLVRFLGVSKDYIEGQVARHVLRDASFAIEEGGFVAIRGRSGSGKSTVLNLVAGIDLPTLGDVFIAETCLNRLSPGDRTRLRRDHMGFVFQFFNLIPTLTVLENVLLPAELSGASGALERAHALLGRVGLDDRLDTFPDRLSGGEQQRVALARALVLSPRLVLADEPTGNLDDVTGREVMELLEAMTRASGRTLILATHSADVAARADRVLTIDAGQLVPPR